MMQEHCRWNSASIVVKGKKHQNPLSTLVKEGANEEKVKNLM